MIAALYAMKALKDSGAELKRRIRLSVGTDEETGGADLERYRKKLRNCLYMHLLPDAMFPVVNSEKSMVVFRVSKALFGQIRCGKIRACERVGRTCGRSGAG